MVSKNEISTPDSDHFQMLFSLASLFKGEFSMDWLHELTGDKPSKILQDLESGVKKGWLIRESTGLSPGGIMRFDGPPVVGSHSNFLL